MGWFDRETEQEKQVRLANEAREAQAKQRAEAQRAADEEAARARTEFAGSWLGQAVAAKVRGDSYLRLEVQHAEVNRDSQFWAGWEESAKVVTNSDTASRMIVEVEEQGWELVSMSTAFVVGVMDFKGGGDTPGGEIGGAGSMLGTYLFRATSVAPAPALVAQLDGSAGSAG